MTYTNNFRHADDIITHLNGIVPGLADPLLRAKYVGFVAVAAVTVYELALKEIFIQFGQKKHKVLGAYVQSQFDRINGRIRIEIIKGTYAGSFGGNYKDRFKKHLDKTTEKHLRSVGRDISSSYENLITWRNDFAHGGKINTTATYQEATQAYEDGKDVLECLAKAMTK